MLDRFRLRVLIRLMVVVGAEAIPKKIDSMFPTVCFSVSCCCLITVHDYLFLNLCKRFQILTLITFGTIKSILHFIFECKLIVVIPKVLGSGHCIRNCRVGLVRDCVGRVWDSRVGLS